MSSSLSDAGLAEPIEAAFAAKPAAVALAINSPGGSPVQSALIAGRIRRLAEARKVPVYAFCEDVAASGGYWLACAGDEIWADASSILGSIGVISAGFGFQEAIGKLGVERRVHTAGARKMMLDPFQEEKAEDVERLLSLQAEIHAAFAAHVRARRGAKLAERDLFTGEFWTGAKAVELGLADGLGHLRAVMEGKLGEKARFREYGARRSFARRIGLAGAGPGAGAPAGLAAEAAAATLEALESRAAWARFGA
ncbi:MAG: S49 family peptidase [Pseudomonadota bacterium]|nr:S49 family peptidase [Pseudomonadota bacterium]MEE3099724.1 S49 family peptidase [Pseudomonadota bacterium]